MAEVGVDDGPFGRVDLVEGSVLGGRRADLVHETDAHQHLGLDPGGKVLDIDVAQASEDLFLTFVAGVEVAEPLAQLGVGVLVHIEIPDAFVVAQEREI